MAGKERSIEIVPLGGGEFEMVENGRNTNELIFDKKHDRIGGKKMRKNDHYDIVFTLDEEGDYTFVTDEDEVMWVDKGSATSAPPCPTSQMHQKQEFKVQKVSDYVLEVKNKDSDRCLYKFVINLVDKRTKTVVPYDPIYDNRNGGVAF